MCSFQPSSGQSMASSHGADTAWQALAAWKLASQAGEKILLRKHLRGLRLNVYLLGLSERLFWLKALSPSNSQ